MVTKFMITELGIYKTRNGTRVKVTEIGNPAKSSANIKGYIERMYRGKMVFKDFDIWCPDGRFKFVGLSNLDIVEKIG